LEKEEAGVRVAEEDHREFKEDDMKLCITSTGKDIKANIDTSFGRCPYFLIIDTATNAIEDITNSAASQTQGAGIAAAQLISNKGVDAVLTGYVGPNASTALREADIKVYEGASSQDTVKEALAKFNKGEFSEVPAVPSEALPRGPGQGRGLGRGMGRGRGRCRRD
jgi:predicted Fe-Mo cluster-binding NifX family protein